MKISIWSIGKTNEAYLQTGIVNYLSRLKHYTKLDYEEFKDVKPGQTADETKKREAELFLSKIKVEDVVILLDERGKHYDSEFSGRAFRQFDQTYYLHNWRCIRSS